MQRPALNPLLTPHSAGLLLILLLYLVFGVLFATRTPPWQAPDEPAHYNYIRQVAAGDLLPLIQAGDWDNDYLELLKANRFAPDLLTRLDTIRYENHQPPLYYWLSAPVYTLTGGNLTALRLVSVILGAGVVLCAYLLGRTLYPQQAHIALGTMALVAFLPQHVAILASVNNDALAWLLVAFTLLLLLIYMRGGRVRAWQLGLLVAAIILTKTTGYFMAGVVPIGILLRYWLAARADGRPLLSRSVLMALLSFALPVALACAFWFGRNVITYGFPDILGLGAHDAVVVGQPRTADRIAALGFLDYLRSGVQTTFNSFWGQFGWMGVPMDAGIYSALQLALGFIVAGWLLGFFRRLPVPDAQNLRRALWAVLWLTLALALLAFVYYNTEFVQFQGRYLFTGLLPLSVLLTLGVDAWRRTLLGRWLWSRWLLPLAFAPLAALDVYLIWRVLPGALSPGL